MAWLAVSVWLGVVAAESAAWRAWTGGVAIVSPSVWVCSLGAAALTVVSARRQAALALVLAGLTMGFVVGGLYWTHWHSCIRELQTTHRSAWRLEIVGDATAGQFGLSAPARVADGVGRGMRIRLNLPKDAAAPELGTNVDVLGQLKVPVPDERGRRSLRKGEVGSITARRVNEAGWAHSVRGMVGPLRAWAVDGIDEVPGTGGDLLAGVVVGDRRRLAGTPAETDFRTTGLTHLVAVSGSHLVVVAAVVGWMLSLTGARRLTRSSIVGAVVGAYVVFSGVQASAVRAWFMAVVASAAWLSGRRADTGAALSVAVICVLASCPANAFDLGFQLSVAAVAGLVFFARLIAAWLEMALPRRITWLAEPMALTLAATAITVPLTVSTFGMFSLVAPLANLLVGPLVDASLLAGILGLALRAVFGPLGRLTLLTAGAVGAFATSIAGWLASLPYAAVPLGFSAGVGAAVCAGALAAVWIAWPRPTRRRATGAVLALVLVWALTGLGPPPTRGASVTVLDIGQGDAILVRDAGHAVLVDTGPSPGDLRSALGRAGVRRLDAVIITHLHADHAGGMSALEGLVDVERVYFAAGATREPSEALQVAQRIVGGEQVAELTAGDSMPVGGVTLDILWPSAPVEDGSKNESSIVLKASTPEFSALLTGDAEGDVLDEIASQGRLSDVDALKVGHHGSSAAVTEKSMAALRPEWALISVGKGNKHGHPTASTLRDLGARGARIVRTDLGGDITLSAGPDGCAVRTRVRN